MIKKKACYLDQTIYINQHTIISSQGMRTNEHRFPSSDVPKHVTWWFSSDMNIRRLSSECMNIHMSVPSREKRKHARLKSTWSEVVKKFFSAPLFKPKSIFSCWTLYLIWSFCASAKCINAMFVNRIFHTLKCWILTLKLIHLCNLKCYVFLNGKRLILVKKSKTKSF